MWPFSSKSRSVPPYASLSTLPDEALVGTILNAVASRPDADRIREALEVRMMNQQHTTMCGAEMVDTLPGADPTQPLNAFIYPFARIAGGGGNVVIAADAGGEPYVLLGRDRGKSEWCVPQGFMNAQHPFNRQHITAHDTSERCPYDVKLMKTGQTPAAGAPAINHLTAEPEPFDPDMAAAARRELQEETGLSLQGVAPQLVHRLTASAALPSALGPQPGQQQCEYYLFDIRGKKMLPPLKAGDDMEEATWVKLSDLQQQGGRIVAQGRPIGVDEGHAIAAALHHIRQQEVEAFGVTLGRVADFSIQGRPESEFGPEAVAWHQNALNVAKTMQQKMEAFKANKTQPPLSGLGSGMGL